MSTIKNLKIIPTIFFFIILFLSKASSQTPDSISSTEHIVSTEYMVSTEYTVSTELPTVIETTQSTESIDSMEETSPSEQSLLDAGLGNVILLPTGDYGILMQSPDHLINGKPGNEILREYLASIGLEGSIYGCWMNDQYYNFFAENIHELVTPDDETFWD